MATPSQSEENNKITVRTVVAFLFFSRDAILKIASSSQARWLGLVLVLLAAIAREYDGEYLVAEPWHLLLPIAASLIGCSVLLVLVYFLAWQRTVKDVSLTTVFGALLNLYWMTAPLAWLYALPVERWLSPGDATRFNLWLLGLVSLWRVALMIRAICVLYGAGVFAAMSTVMSFSLALGGVALRFIPSPVFMVMGGIRLTESESQILGTRFLLIFVGVVTAPIWLIGYIVSLNVKQPWHWQLAQWPGKNLPVAKSAWAFSFVCLLAWIPILLRTQPEQQLRWQAERMLLNGEYEQLSQLTRDCDQREFPPHWDPPPRVGYGENKPKLATTLVQLRQHQPAAWFWKLYVDKNQRKFVDPDFALMEMSNEELEILGELIAELQPSPQWSRDLQKSIDFIVTMETISEERKALLRTLRDRLPKD